MTTKEATFISTYWRFAILAGKRYNISPIIILAQAALESDWGTSTIAKKAKNFFGLTVGGPAGATPHYIPGKVYNASTGLKFRAYDNALENFMDFGYFIRYFRAYEKVRPYTQNLGAYAKAIAASKYISEENGDNRNSYYLGILSRAAKIQEVAVKEKVRVGQAAGIPLGVPVLIMAAALLLP